MNEIRKVINKNEKGMIYHLFKDYDNGDQISIHYILLDGESIPKTEADGLKVVAKLKGKVPMSIKRVDQKEALITLIDNSLLGSQIDDTIQTLERAKVLIDDMNKIVDQL